MNAQYRCISLILFIEQDIEAGGMEQNDALLSEEKGPSGRLRFCHPESSCGSKVVGCSEGSDEHGCPITEAEVEQLGRGERRTAEGASFQAKTRWVPRESGADLEMFGPTCLHDSEHAQKQERCIDTSEESSGVPGRRIRVQAVECIPLRDTSKCRFPKKQRDNTFR